MKAHALTPRALRRATVQCWRDLARPAPSPSWVARAWRWLLTPVEW